MCNYTQEQLDETWENINNGKYGNDPSMSIGRIKALSGEVHTDWVADRHSCLHYSPEILSGSAILTYLFSHVSRSFRAISVFRPGAILPRVPKEQHLSQWIRFLSPARIRPAVAAPDTLATGSFLSQRLFRPGGSVSS